MADTATTEATESAEAAKETSTEATTEAQTSAADSEKTSGEDALGDAGKKALDAMKAKWKNAEAEVKTEREARAALEAKVAGKEAEYAAEKQKREAEQAALSKANDRIRKSEIKAAAKGVLADPQDAYRFLDVESFEVDDDGNVDEDAIADALAKLVKDKPYLAAQGGKRFQGSADGGARNDATKVAQLSDADMARMTPEQVVEAHEKGQFDDLLASG